MAFHSLALLNNLIGLDGILVLVIGLLIFGRRVPAVVRNVKRASVAFDPHGAAFFFAALVLFGISVLMLVLKWLSP